MTTKKLTQRKVIEQLELIVLWTLQLKPKVIEQPSESLRRIKVLSGLVESFIKEQ